jgi:two-component system phosphate regulon sensor histidine kinase PhoR
MRRSRLLWRVYPPYLIVSLVGLLVISLLVAPRFHAFYLDRVAEDLAARARLFAQAVGNELTVKRTPALEATAERLGHATGTRLTVIDSDGLVLADSDHDPETMENHGQRPEVRAALSGSVGRAERRSATLGRPFMYVSVPLPYDDRTLCVRAAVPVASLADTLALIDRQFLFGALAIAILGALASLLSLRAVSRALDDLSAGAARFAAGDLATRLPLPDSAELAELAEAMNTMAGELAARMATVVAQRNELTAVLGSMNEAVLAVDTDHRLVSINRAAGEMFGIEPRAVAGRTLHEMVRNRDLQRFVDRALNAEEPQEGDVTLFDGEERYLQAHGTRLDDGAGRRLGVLVVLYDMTRVRRLENLRREFVANVSHELRTPITSIRGFVETLLAGAIEDEDKGRHFLEIIDRQADRLGTIIEDLLSLSRLEQSPDARAIELRDTPLSGILTAAAQGCAVKSAEKGIILEVAPVDSDLRARLDPALLEEAVVNLLDNAIAYSEPGATVHLAAGRTDGEVRIEVRDHGCGIAADHLPRLFERFYRVDKARSRKQGGTGLGLAIVKHIMSVHGGTVTVESVVGKGSTFRLLLPVSEG